ncbi:MAG TPA: recombinase RecT [Candidatus Desulfovibrio gallistercoris]|nr:recombinase RecT [Candidatus Desulfovibrio gallistercoris]
MSMIPHTYQQNRQPAVIASVTDLLKNNMKAIQSCLPKHMTPERMCRIAVQTISKSKQLQRCSPQSLVAAIVEASSLGLEIDVRGQAYLVPYRDTVTLIPGYKGLMDLAYRSGRVANIYAETVCENDEFSFRLGLSPTLEHTPNLENRGDLRAVYAVARLKEADPVFVVLGKSEVEKVRKASKASGDGPWKTWEEEMWKKTAIRRLCKYLPLSPEMQRAVAIDEAADAGSPQHLAEAVIDLPPESFSGSTVEALSSALTAPSPAEAVNVTPADEPEAPAAVPAGDPAEDAAKETAARKKTRKTDTASAGGTAAPEAPDAAPSATQDMPTIPCPRRDGGLVSTDDCFYCQERKGCPAREEPHGVFILETR